MAALQYKIMGQINNIVTKLAKLVSKNMNLAVIHIHGGANLISEGKNCTATSEGSREQGGIVPVPLSFRHLAVRPRVSALLTDQGPLAEVSFRQSQPIAANCHDAQRSSTTSPCRVVICPCSCGTE